MIGPKRLLSETRNDLTRALLDSAREDGPTERSYARAVAAAASAGAVTGLAAEASAASSLVIGLLNVLGIGALAATVVALGSDRSSVVAVDAAGSPAALVATVTAAAANTALPVQAVPEAPATVDAPNASPPVTETARPSVETSRVGPPRAHGPRADLSAHVAAPSSAPSPPAQVEAAAPSVLPASSAPEGSPAPPSPAPSDGLGEELAAVDAIRSHLARGEVAAAFQALGRYEKRYPRGRFVQETLILRVEALAASGRCAEAVTLSAGFVERFPASVLAKRIRTLTAACR